MILGLSVGNILGGLVGTLVIAFVAWFFEQELGVKHYAHKIYAKAVNSPAEIKINYNYESNMPFEEIKKKSKEDFSEEFDSIEVNKSSSSKLALNVNQRFEVNIRREASNKVSISTNKLVVNMRSVKRDLTSINEALRSFETLDKDRSKSSSHFVELEDVKGYFFISTSSTFFNIYKSRSLDLRSYNFELVHSEDNFTIKATKGRYEVLSNSFDGLEDGVAEIV